jgi:hypothetical protein
MKKLITFLVLCFLGWQIYTKHQHKLSSLAQTIRLPNLVDETEQPKKPKASPTFRCDGRIHCSQMTSRAEAEFFLDNCPNVRMDGDRDGDPCEDYNYNTSPPTKRPRL